MIGSDATGLSIAIEGQAGGIGGVDVHPAESPGTDRSIDAEKFVADAIGATDPDEIALDQQRLIICGADEIDPWGSAGIAGGFPKTGTGDATQCSGIDVVKTGAVGPG